MSQSPNPNSSSHLAPPTPSIPPNNNNSNNNSTHSGHGGHGALAVNTLLSPQHRSGNGNGNGASPNNHNGSGGVAISGIAKPNNASPHGHGASSSVTSSSLSPSSSTSSSLSSSVRSGHGHNNMMIMASTSPSASSSSSSSTIVGGHGHGMSSSEVLMAHIEPVLTKVMDFLKVAKKNPFVNQLTAATGEVLEMVYTSSKSESKNTSSLIFQLNSSSSSYISTGDNTPRGSNGNGNSGALAPPPPLISTGSHTGRNGSIGSRSDIRSVNSNSSNDNDNTIDIGINSIHNNNGSNGCNDPIVDIKVLFHKKEDKVPIGYTLLKKSVGGGVAADLNKASGGRNVYLCYKRQSQVSSLSTPRSVGIASSSPSVSSTLSLLSGSESVSNVSEDRPITAMLIFFPDKQEEPPYGFTAITTAADGTQADLNAGQGGRNIMLSVHRGDGAPITDIGIIFREKKEILPSGFHEMKRSPLGHKADLNPLATDTNTVFLCFRPNVQPVLANFNNYTTPLEEGFAKCLAVLTACLYTFDQRIVVAAFEAFKRLPSQYVPFGLLNTYISSVCDAVPLLFTYFTTEGFTNLVKFLEWSEKNYLSMLRVDIAVKMLEVCFLLRHEDKHTQSSACIIDHIIAVVLERTKHQPCTCRRDSLVRSKKDTNGLCIRCGRANGSLTHTNANANAITTGTGTPHQMMNHNNSTTTTTTTTISITTTITATTTTTTSSSTLSPHGHGHGASNTTSLVSVRASAVNPTGGVSGNSSNGVIAVSPSPPPPPSSSSPFSSLSSAPRGVASSSSSPMTGTGPSSLVSLSTIIPTSPTSSSSSSSSSSPSSSLSSSSWLYAYAAGIVNRLVHHVVVMKAMDPDVGRFQRHVTTGRSFRHDAWLIADTLWWHDRGGLDIHRIYRRRIVKKEKPKDTKEDRKKKRLAREAAEQAAAAAAQAAADAAAAAVAAGTNATSSTVGGTVTTSQSSDPLIAATTATATIGAITPSMPSSVSLSSLAGVINKDGNNGNGNGNGNSSSVDVITAAATAAREAAEREERIRAADERDAKRAAEEEEERRAKEMERDERRRHTIECAELTRKREDLSDSREERTLMAITLLCCKIAQESAPFGTRESEARRRKVHALKLLLSIISKSVPFWRSSLGSIVLLRRFVVPSLMSCLITDNTAFFRLVLQIYTVLWENFKDQLATELGIWLDQLLIPLLDNPYCTLDQKKDILDLFLQLFKPPEAIIELFYNFDNQTKQNWHIYTRLVTLVSKITEGEMKKGGTLSANQAGTGHVNGAKVEEKKITAEQEAQQIAEEALQQSGLRLLTHLLHMCARWLAVPGFKRSSPPPTHHTPLVVETLGDDEWYTKGSTQKERPERTGTWAVRVEKHKADARVVNHALKLAKSESLKAAIKYIKVVSPSGAVFDEIAAFLRDNDSLDKSEIGDILGDLSNSVLTEEDHNELRLAYVKLLDFTGMTFDGALRTYLCESGFRMPGEAQKIDRLLEAFCVGFCRDNPDVFRAVGPAFVVCFAMVMLNTELHNANLKSGPARKVMTVDQFCSNLRGVDDGNDFPRTFLAGFYDSIAAQAIEWEDKKAIHHTSSTTVPLGGNNNDGRTEAEIRDSEEKALRKFLELIVRKAQALVKSQATIQKSYQSRASPQIVQAMFEASWFSYIAAISARVESTRDIDVLHSCLDALAYGSTIAIQLSLETEWKAFVNVLAKITFIEKNRAVAKAGTLPKRIIQGEHLSQEWYKPLTIACDKYPTRACKTVLSVANEAKQRISYEKQQSVLRQIQSEFGGDISLVEPGRSFIKSGQLAKITGKSKARVDYHFFLFSDLIIYASEGMQTKYKMHRVVHLSLCRIVDIRSASLSHAFKVVNPQKSFTVCAPSAKAKLAWIEAIHLALKAVRAQRKKFMAGTSGDDHMINDKKTPTGNSNNNSNGNSNGLTSSNMAPDPDDPETLRRYSSFVGSSDPSLLGIEAGRSLPHCKLCIRTFTMFRRRFECPWCKDQVCSDCSNKKSNIPGDKKGASARRVCDACYGVLQGMVSDDRSLLSVAEG